MSLNPYSDTVQCTAGLVHLLFPHMQSCLASHWISIHLFIHRPLCRPFSVRMGERQLSKAQGSFLVRYDAGEWGHYASAAAVVAAPPIKMQTARPLA